jgi:hypothetical protein
MKVPHEAYGIVDTEYIQKVEKYAERKFIRVGKFDLHKLDEMLELLFDETSGEVEVFALDNIVMPSVGTSGIIAIKYDDGDYVAVGGIRE